VPALLGFAIGVAVSFRVGLVLSDLRRQRRVFRQHPSAASTTIADEVEKWLRDRG
jgi:hypothetical protein